MNVVCMDREGWFVAYDAYTQGTAFSPNRVFVAEEQVELELAIMGLERCSPTVENRRTGSKKFEARRTA